MKWELNVLWGSGSSTFAALAIVTFASAFLNWPLDSLPFFYPFLPPLLLFFLLSAWCACSSSLLHSGISQLSHNQVIGSALLAHAASVYLPFLPFFLCFNLSAWIFCLTWILSMLLLTLHTKPQPTWLHFNITVYHLTYNSYLIQVYTGNTL